MSLVMRLGPRVWGCLNVESHTLLWRNLTSARSKPTFEGPLPPKKCPNPYLIYCKERLDILKGGRANLCIIAREWREMSSQDKDKYVEKFKEARVKHKSECDLFYGKFSDEKEVENYKMKLDEYRKNMIAYRSNKKVKRKPIKVSVFQAMKIDRTARLPVDERFDYVLNKANIEYKKLTSEEWKKYEKMADEIYKQRLEKYNQTITTK